ncbi:MAG: hypothetical protein PHG75_06490 [Syntrophomonas sp.]|nr:hypothetical protein [Syntrophomonas sp.]
MKKQLGVFSDWHKNYLNVIDNLYGLEENPVMTMTEITEQWHRVLGTMNKAVPETSPFLGGIDTYISALEEMHGELVLHPLMSVMERCEEWQRCFSANPVSLQVRTKPTVSGEERRTWALTSAS